MAETSGIGDLAAAGLSSLNLGSLRLGNVLDSVEFVKNAWSSFGVPSSLAPTVDLDEIDRRIADLKAVEQWLALNLNLLQASVQALEIQRGTIATLKAYGDALGAQAIPGAQALAQALAAAAASGTIAPPPARTGAGDAPAADAHRAPAPEAAPAQEDRNAGRGAPAGAAAPGAALAQPGLDPAAWWDLLQRQFHDLAAAALGGATAADVPAGRAGRAKRASPAGAPAKGGAPVARGTKTASQRDAAKATVGQAKPGRGAGKR